MEVIEVTGKDNQTFVVEVNHGVAGPRGFAAGFGQVSASATPLSPGEEPVVGVESSGPDTAKNIHFTFGIPESGVSQADWNESDPSSDSYINNKPSLSAVATSGSYDDLIDSPDLSLKEDKSNKVTSLSSSSTDTQYPSAKCVYDTIQNIDFPDHYEVGEVYMVTRAGLESSSDDIHMRIFKNGVGIRQQTFNMELSVTGGGSVNSIGKYAFTTDMGGYVPPLQEIPFISEFYINYWINGRFSYSTLNVNIYDLDTVTFLCGVTVTRNIVSDTVSDNDSRPVLSDAVYEYAENKSNKVTSISSSSTDTQYPSAKCVYDAIEAKHPDEYEVRNVQMRNNYVISFAIVKNGEPCGETQFKLQLNVGSQYYASEFVNMTTNSNGTITLSDTSIAAIQAWLTTGAAANYLATYFNVVVYEYNTSNILCDFTVTRNPVTGAVTENSKYAVTSGGVYNAINNLPQANWDETSLSSKAYIQNKPTNVSAFTNDAGYVTASQVPAAQVNSDWNAVSGVSEILNKPDLTLKEDKSNKVLVISSASTDTEYPSAKAVYHETNGLSLMLANHTADIYNLEVGKENLTNKVTSMSASSTDTQYPSAKCVYDAIEILDATVNYRLTYVEDNKEDSWKKVTSIGPSSTDAQYPSAKCVYDAIQAIPSQVQSDWNQTDNTAPDYIKNKPVIPTVPTNVSAFTNDANYTTVTDATDIAYGEVELLRNSLSSVATSGSYTDLTDKPTIPAPQVQADWQQNDSTAPDYIKHRPSLPSAQIQSDWTQTNSNEVDYIKHKPSLSAVATSGSYNDLSNKPTLATVATTGSYSDLSGKPSFATVATSGSYTDLSDKPVIPAGQIQSDWSQTNTGSLDYIKNKPNLNLKEDVSNKVTTLSAQSTDTQYPSAKATYGILSNVESMLEDTEETVQTWLTYKEDLSNKSQQFRDNTANMVNYPSTIAVVDYVNDKMSGLDYTDSVSGDYVTSVSETDGVISLTKGSKGTISSGSTGLVDGDTVYTALQSIGPTPVYGSSSIIMKPTMNKTTYMEFPDCEYGQVLWIPWNVYVPQGSGVTINLSFEDGDLRHFLDLDTGDIYEYGNDYRKGYGSGDYSVTSKGILRVMKIYDTENFDFQGYNNTSSTTPVIVNKVVSSMMQGEIKNLLVTINSQTGTNNYPVQYQLDAPSGGATYRITNTSTGDIRVVENNGRILQYTSRTKYSNRRIIAMYSYTIERLT